MSFFNTGSLTVENSNITSQRVNVPATVTVARKTPFKWVINAV